MKNPDAKRHDALGAPGLKRKPQRLGRTVRSHGQVLVGHHVPSRSIPAPVVRPRTMPIKRPAHAGERTGEERT